VKSKKVLSVLSFGVAASVALVGCGQSTNSSSGSGSSGKTVTLNALFMKQAGYSEANIEDMTKAFEAKYPNIKVNLSFVPYDSLHDKIVTGLATGANSYDAVLVDTIWTPEFAKAGFIEDLSGKLPSSFTSGAYQPALGTVEYQGQYYGVPWIMDTKYFYYNSKMLQQAGISKPPTTWSQVLNDSKILKSKNIVKYPLDWSWSQAEALVCDYATLVSDFGGQIVNDKGDLVVNQGGAMAALNFMVASLKDGLTNPGSTQSLEDDVRKVMSQGQAAFSLNWTYAYALENDKSQSDVAGQVGVEPVPGTSAVPFPAPSVNGAMGLAIAKSSAHPQQALEYIEYLASQPVEDKYAQLSLPFYKSSLKEQSVIKTAPALVKAASIQFNNIVNRPAVPQYQTLSHILQVQIQKALLGQETPQKAMDDAVAQWNSQKSGS